MYNKLEMEKEAAKARYYELLEALEKMKVAHGSMLFEISPNQALFDRMYENNSVNPLHIEFKSQKTGAIFKLENEFFPHGSVMTIPEDATKEETSCVVDLILETAAHPNDAHEDYEPKLLFCFPEGTPEEEIFELIEAAQAKGIEVNLFIGKESDFEKMEDVHKQKTKELIAAGEYKKLPGWDGLMSSVRHSPGGRAGEDMMEKYKSENRGSPRCC